MRLICAVALSAMALCLSLATTVHAAASPAPTPSPTPDCAWGIVANPLTDNVGTPDSAATYWLTPFTAQAGMSFRLSGRYPDARYMSMEVTKPGTGGLFTSDGVSSEVTDYLIQPDAGSVNPWQRAAWLRRPGEGDSFTLNVQWNVSPGEANTLPLAPTGTTTGTSYLLYRVYLPAGGDFGKVPLPAITITENGVSSRLPRCTTDQASLPAAGSAWPATPAASSSTSIVPFLRPAPGSGAGASPNADSGYLVAAVTPPGGDDVVVIQGRAPTHVLGPHPFPWPAPGIDMRYWSMCSNLATSTTPLVVNQLADGSIDYGCRYDSETRVDALGNYTYVLGTEAQRGAIDSIPDATFLPFSTAYPTTTHILLLRNMLVSPTFAEAIQNVPQNSDPSSAAAVMGTYYPRMAICPLPTLATRGASYCLAQFGAS